MVEDVEPCAQREDERGDGVTRKLCVIGVSTGRLRRTEMAERAWEGARRRLLHCANDDRSGRGDDQGSLRDVGSAESMHFDASSLTDR